MQEQMNSMSDSGGFQDVESKFCEMLSHVSSQPVMIPSSRSLLSRDKRLRLSGLQKTFLKINHRIQSDDVQRNRETVPEADRTKTGHTSKDRQNQDTFPIPTFATSSLTTSSTRPVELSQNYMVGQHRQQTSELQIDKFSNPQSFLMWKIRFLT